MKTYLVNKISCLDTFGVQLGALGDWPRIGIQHTGHQEIHVAVYEECWALATSPDSA